RMGCGPRRRPVGRRPRAAGVGARRVVGPPGGTWRRRLPGWAVPDGGAGVTAGHPVAVAVLEGEAEVAAEGHGVAQQPAVGGGDVGGSVALVDGVAGERERERPAVERPTALVEVLGPRAMEQRTVGHDAVVALQVAARARSL